ncbi:unnamed protein product [Strongylus vulgaris]|uniref:Uncharacterized protein n=1 Tax=Strongylus vulgaris TaxID=40348 RepID=A0A3P7K532_STRVU|nr:unnamed protein product [Strongylus vulgaris]
MDSNERPGLIMAYVTEPDRTGHKHKGPKQRDEIYELGDLQLERALIEVDNALSQFLKMLEKEGLWCCVNLVIVSDHGMAQIDTQVVLKKRLNITGMYIVPGLTAHIFKENSTMTIEEIESALTRKEEEGKKDLIRVFTNKTMPLRYYYSHSRRIGDLVLVSQPHVQVVM